MGQEPGTAEEIQQFCSTTYGVTFPLFEKIDVNGEQRHPLYDELTEVPDAEGQAGDITWNFEKFLVSPAGEVVGRFRPQVEPEDPALRGGHRGRAPGLSNPVTDAAFAAAIFDMDGLLVDSETLWHEAEIEILGGLGVPLPRRRCRQTKGMFVGEVTEYWYARYPVGRPDPRRGGGPSRRPGDRPGPGEGRAQARGARAAIALCRAPRAGPRRRLVVAVPPDRHACSSHFGLRREFALVHSAEDEP